jgi:hypothetical protein
MEVLVMSDAYSVMPEAPSLEELVAWDPSVPRYVPPVWVAPVQYEVLREWDPGKWVRVLGPTTRLRAEGYWVRNYRDGGPGLRVQEVSPSA